MPKARFSQPFADEGLPDDSAHVLVSEGGIEYTPGLSAVAPDAWRVQAERAVMAELSCRSPPNGRCDFSTLLMLSPFRSPLAASPGSLPVPSKQKMRLLERGSSLSSVQYFSSLPETAWATGRARGS